MQQINWNGWDDPNDEELPPPHSLWSWLIDIGVVLVLLAAVFMAIS